MARRVTRGATQHVLCGPVATRSHSSRRPDDARDALRLSASCSRGARAGASCVEGPEHGVDVLWLAHDLPVVQIPHVEEVDPRCG